MKHLIKYFIYKNYYYFLIQLHKKRLQKLKTIKIQFFPKIFK